MQKIWCTLNVLREFFYLDLVIRWIKGWPSKDLSFRSTLEIDLISHYGNFKKRIKYLGINLTKDVKDPYTGNYKAFLRDWKRQ